MSNRCRSQPVPKTQKGGKRGRGSYLTAVSILGEGDRDGETSPSKLRRPMKLSLADKCRLGTFKRCFNPMLCCDLTARRLEELQPELKLMAQVLLQTPHYPKTIVGDW